MNSECNSATGVQMCLLQCCNQAGSLLCYGGLPSKKERKKERGNVERKKERKKKERKKRNGIRMEEGKQKENIF